MTYLFCRALAELTGSQLCVDPWAGEKIFDIPVFRPTGNPVRMNAIEALDWAQPDFSGNFGKTNRRSGGCNAIEVRDYCQIQRCMIYTKRDAQSWLKIRPEIGDACKSAIRSNYGCDAARVVFHHRKGDLIGYGYPQVSLKSYYDACGQFGIDVHNPNPLVLSEESPILHEPFLPDDLAFMPDFYRMMTAPTLLRGNSSFSWIAALLGNGLVLSPVVDGLEGGKEHDCQFVAGNWPKFTNLDFVEDLHVAP